MKENGDVYRNELSAAGDLEKETALLQEAEVAPVITMQTVVLTIICC